MDETVFAWVVVISAALDLIVALGLLFARNPRLGLARLGEAVAGTAVFFGAKAVLLLGGGVKLFGLICLIYVDLVILVPIAGLVVLGASAIGRIPAARGVRAIAGLSLLGPFVGAYATFWEPFNLEVESAEVPVDAARAGHRPIRIGVLSDIQVRHVTSYEHAVIDRLMALHPDLILLPGDVFQGDESAFDHEREALRELLAKLDAPGGVFLVQGDVDRGTGRVARLVDGTKITLLFNETARRTIGDRNLWIGGVELDYSGPSARETTRALEDRPGDDDIRIVLAHRPDVVETLRPSSRVDLVVSGHTHGGQVVIPGFGPLITLSHVPRRVAAGGLHRLDGNRIYVSRGVGCERGQAPRIRFLCPPELSILTLGGRRETSP